jgi:hypothetical protein
LEKRRPGHILRRGRKNRKHTISYYLMCGAPLTPIAHLEQLFAEGEPVLRRANQGRTSKPRSQRAAMPALPRPRRGHRAARAARRAAGRIVRHNRATRVQGRASHPG